MNSPYPFDLNLTPTASPASSGASNSDNIAAPTQSPPKSLPQTHLLRHFFQGTFSNSTFDYPPHQVLGQNITDENACNIVYSDFSRLWEFFRPEMAEEVQYNGDVLKRRRVERRCLDERYFRYLVRKTRMIYNSLRILVRSCDEVKRNGSIRSDLKAANYMMSRGLCLNRDKRILGSIPGVQIGDIFFYKRELCIVGLHGQIQAGIDYLPSSLSPNGKPLTTSIVLSHGYGHEDDEDHGHVLIYTGEGGRHSRSTQLGNNLYRSGNLGFETSMQYQIQIRVIRGFEYCGSPSGKVYVYDGLYRIIDAGWDTGKSGFPVFKYKLVRKNNQPYMGSDIMKIAQDFRNGPLYDRPFGYLGLDLSGGKEKVPVLLFNNLDFHIRPAPLYDYITRSVFPRSVGTGLTGCNCVDGCNDKCVCAMKNGGDFAYNKEGLLVRGKPLIFECGPSCGCPPNCRNRVSQRGLKYMFEVFRSKRTRTGWSVRSLDLIQVGSFICEYAGIVLTREQANGLNGDSLIYPDRFGKRWGEWGNLSSLFSDYVHPEHPSTLPLSFALDVSRRRNVACYIGHSSTGPNVMVQFVLYDHNNLSFPHVMLFALENIPPLAELSLDYGVDQMPVTLRS